MLTGCEVLLGTWKAQRKAANHLKKERELEKELDSLPTVLSALKQYLI